MSLVEVGPLDIATINEKVVQCCDKHILVDSKIIRREGENISYINIQSFNPEAELAHRNDIIRHKDHLISSLEKENLFLKEQLRALNCLVDQVTAANRISSVANGPKLYSTANIPKFHKIPQSLARFGL
ncbi:uncharacterized protein LOC115885752 isoform X2 [Sitophilus oryzae]|uniref:Uncharacterized protein LOC115885752 isoform X2 n=1 Tax=Sitophilus oryzae TaxID=7048 RepID=A0A6J2YBI0_SITOR|nr:uncharacterized protein LOC115885752 isoform X2 [Sitophilus oryzae]